MLIMLLVQNWKRALKRKKIIYRWWLCDSVAVYLFNDSYFHEICHSYFLKIQFFAS